MGSRKRKKEAPQKKVRKKTDAEKRAKKERQAKYEWIFIRGKSARVLRAQPDLVEGIPRDEFIRRNADWIWLKQNEMWEELMEFEINEGLHDGLPHPEPPWSDWDDDPPGWDELSLHPIEIPTDD